MRPLQFYATPPGGSLLPPLSLEGCPILPSPNYSPGGHAPPEPPLASSLQSPEPLPIVMGTSPPHRDWKASHCHMPLGIRKQENRMILSVICKQRQPDRSKQVKEIPGVLLNKSLVVMLPQQILGVHRAWVQVGCEGDCRGQTSSGTRGQINLFPTWSFSARDLEWRS